MILCLVSIYKFSTRNNFITKFVNSSQWFFYLYHMTFVNSNKDVRYLSSMSHGVMHFWLLFNFVFISAFFDILASLSISRVFISSISGRWKSSCLDIPRTIIKFRAVASQKFLGGGRPQAKRAVLRTAVAEPLVTF